MKAKLSYIIVAIVGIALWTLVIIFKEDKTSTLIGLLMTIFAIVLGATLEKKYKFYEKMDKQSQKFFKWFLIIGSIITIICLIALAYYIHSI